MPSSNGGFALKSFKVYSNNVVVATLQPTLTTNQLITLTQGTTYKIQVSSVNEVGESALSDAITVLFANVPTAPVSLTLTSTSLP